MVVEFMEHWPLPECAETIVGNSLDDVAKQVKQNAHYQTLKNQIETKFNNSCGKARIVAMSTATGKSMATSLKKKIIFSLKSHHHLWAVQIYSQHYYNIHVQPAIKKAIQLSCTPLTQGQKLTLINKLTQETCKSESKENSFMRSEPRLPREENGAQKNTLNFLSAIDAAPTLLNCFLHDLALQTGWWFTVIAGGPDPADGENIHTGSFHIGVNGHKKHFKNEYTHHSVNPKDSSTHCMTFEEGIIAPYGQFLKTLFSQQACNQADLQVLKETVNDDECEATPGLSGLISMPPSSPSPPISSFQPLSVPVPAVLPCSMQSPPNPSSPSPSNADVASSSIIPTSHSELTSAPTKSSGELGGEEFDPQLFWQDNTFSHEYFLMGATEHDQLTYNNLLGHTAFDDERESFPFTSDATFGDDNRADLRISSEHHQCLQPELEGSQLPLLPSPGSNQIDEHRINADLLSVVPRSSFLTDVDGELTLVLMVNSELQKRQHRVIKRLQGEGESVIADDDGGEDHKRRTSKHA
ncbi:hypothetical protein EDD85DRAFT_953349 [Armillaria nabsnona]|nr:hypothetical protein EDD85DRAFT_953349 [Armillaria nabsnona]